MKDLLSSYLKKVITQNLKNKYKSNRRKDRVEIHATDIIQLCPRYAVLCYWLKLPITIEKEFPAKTYLTFRIGDKIEDIVREIIGGTKPPPMGFKIHDLYIVGSPDILYQNKYLIECKSIKAEYFNNLQSPVEKHRAQLSFYLYLSQRLSVGYSDTGAIIYVPKEEATDIVKIFDVKLSKTYISMFDNFVESIKKGIKEKKLPQRFCKNTNSLYARECKVVRECFKRR